MLELSDKLSDLGALCVTFWKDLQEFPEFTETDQNNDFISWMEKKKKETKTKERIKEIEFRLKQHIQTQIQFRKKSQERFLINIGERLNPNPRSECSIDLSKAKDRSIIETKVSQWWQNSSRPVCYLEGEERSGKTWLAAKWAKSIYSDQHTVLIWLDYDQWKDCEHLDSLLETSIKSIYGSQIETRINKLKYKFCNTWTMTTLIILDGIKDWKSSTEAKRILDEFFEEFHSNNNKWGHSIRLLLTTVSLENENHSSTDYLWKGCQRISVEPYSDSDSLTVLTHTDQQYITPHSLWTDLIGKIEDGDSQVRVDLALSESANAVEILASLAKRPKWTIVDSATPLTAQLFKDCFSNFSEARQQIEEQLVAVETDRFHIEVNQDHVKLGWALYFFNLFESFEFAKFDDFTNHYYQELEPLLTDELRTEALFLALQITAIFPRKSQIPLVQKRSALLLALFKCTEPVLTQERLLFWAEQDTDAYVQFVQYAFKDHLSPYEEEAIVGPLAHIWQQKTGQVNILSSSLTNWLSPSEIENVDEKGENVNNIQDSFPTIYYTQNRLSAAALSIVSLRPERQFLNSLALCYEKSKANVKFRQDIGTLMRWGYTESILSNMSWLPEITEQYTDLLIGVRGLAAELKQANLPILLQRQLSKEDRERSEFAKQRNSTFKLYIDRIRAQEKLFIDGSPDVNVNTKYHGLDYLAVRTDIPDLHDEDVGKIMEVLHYISDNAELGKAVDATQNDFCIQNLLPFVAKYDSEGYSQLACSLKLNTLNQTWAQFKLRSIQGVIFNPEDCEKISTAIHGMKERLVCSEELYSDVEWLTALLTETLLFCASEEILTDWFMFLASQETLRYSICYESLPYLFEHLLPSSIVELAQKKLEKHRDSSHEDQNQSGNISEEFSEEEFWCALFAYASKVEDRAVKYALEDLKMRKPDSTGTFPMLRLAYSNPKLFLDEILIDENIRKHLFSQNGRKWIIRAYDGDDVPSYEVLRSFIPIELMGSYLCGTDQCEDLSRWGIDLMKWVLSILQNAEHNSDALNDTMFPIRREVLEIWAEQNQSDFLYLSDKFLTALSNSPLFQQSLSDFADIIYCLLLRFKPETAINLYHQRMTARTRIIYSNQYGIDTLLSQLWKVEQCNSPRHVEFRRTLLDDCHNDEDIMYMTIAAISGGGEKELWDLVQNVYLKSHYAKERCLGVSILQWFGTSKSIEILEDLKSNDPSLWVRNHSTWAYEVAQQERSCREVYREALQTHDLYKISAVFEQIAPALSPTARWWHQQIEKEELSSKLEENNPKMFALITRFWYWWAKSSKTRQNIEIYGRKLKDYSRGEKLAFGSRPRLAPWWKPE